MSEAQRWYLVMYDIRDQERWRKAYRIVRGFAKRVQYSVFRFRGSRRKMEELRFELERVLAREDDLLIIELCGTCAARIRIRNPDGGWEEDDDVIIL